MHISILRGALTKSLIEPYRAPNKENVSAYLDFQISAHSLVNAYLKLQISIGPPKPRIQISAHASILGVLIWIFR